MYKFRACHLCTFNVGAIFFGVISTYGVLPYAKIYNTGDVGYQELVRLLCYNVHFLTDPLSTPASYHVYVTNFQFSRTQLQSNLIPCKLSMQHLVDFGHVTFLLVSTVGLIK